MNNSTLKEEWRLYLIFFLIGILSFPFAILMGIPPFSPAILQINILCNLIQCGFEYYLFLSFLFPLLICSILFAVVLYAYKKRSFIFALKAFAAFFAASVLILFVSILFLSLRFLPLLIFVILFIIGSTAFKVQPLINFTLRAFAISFGVLFLIIGTFMAFTYEDYYDKWIDVRKLQDMPDNYVNITDEELEKYPALKEAISGEGCTKSSEYRWSCKVHPDEWIQTRIFIEKKTAYVYLFSMDRTLEEDLNKGSITRGLKDTFESEGYPLSENLFIRKIEWVWIGSAPSIDRWWMEDEKGKNFYYIWKEDDRLDVYDRLDNPFQFIKVGENYYELPPRPT